MPASIRTRADAMRARKTPNFVCPGAGPIEHAPLAAFREAVCNQVWTQFCEHPASPTPQRGAIEPALTVGQTRATMLVEPP